MFLTRPSVSLSVGQSVSPVFLVSATPLKPLNKISWNVVVMKDMMCRCAYPKKIFIQYFLGVTPFLNLEIWPKWKILSATPLKPLTRISWNFVFVKDIPWRCAYPQEILIHFFSRNNALFEFRNVAKMKDTTQNSSSAQVLWNRWTEFPETI